MHYYNLSFGFFAILCYLCTVITGWSYGNSYAIYVVISIIMAIFAYLTFFSIKNKINRTIKLIISIVLFSTLFLGLMNEDLTSSIMVNISLLMPISLSTLNISYDKFYKQIVLASVINLGIIIQIGSNFRNWNSNSLAFMIFCGITVGMIWFKFSHRIKSLFCSTAYLLFAMSLLLATGSRNAGIIIIICYIMLIIPSRTYKNATIYRGIYLTAILLTVFSVDFQMYILHDEQIMDYLLSYTTSFSEKAWGMDTHYLLLQVVSSKFANMDIFTQLFGTGVKAGHCHNLFYQCLFFYGYVGTLLIYIFYIYVFERAYRLIVQCGDTLALCCFIILIGHFLLQISEVYMVGAESINVMSALPSAVILHRWHKYTDKHSII